MKKLKLTALKLGAMEVLSREQLKSINGGCSSSIDCEGGMTCFEGVCTGHNFGSGSGSAGPGSWGEPGGFCQDGFQLCENYGCVPNGMCAS